MIKKKLVIPTISWVNKHTRSSISHHSHFHEFNGKKYDFQINSVDYNAQIQWLFFSSLAISIFEYKLLFMCLAVDLCCMCHRILKIVAFFAWLFSISLVNQLKHSTGWLRVRHTPTAYFSTYIIHIMSSNYTRESRRFFVLLGTNPLWKIRFFLFFFSLVIFLRLFTDKIAPWHARREYIEWCSSFVSLMHFICDFHTCGK